MEGGNATDGAGGTDETGQGEPMRESSPTSPTKTARSIEESNLPFGLGRGHVELVTVARPERQLPSGTTKVARPKRLSPADWEKGLRQPDFSIPCPITAQDILDAEAVLREQASPATVVMSPGDQAQVARWKEQSLLPRIVPPGHEPGIGQRRVVSPTTAAMPSVPGETTMLCPLVIAPVRYETGIGQPTTSLMPLGQVASSSHGSTHGFPKGKEVFTDAVMDDDLDNVGEDLQTLLEDGVPSHRQSPLHFQGLDAYEIETSYSSEDSTEVFATNDTFSTAFFESQQMQPDNVALVSEQRSCTEGAEERVQAHEMAQASDQEVLTDNGDDRAQAQPDLAEVPAPLAEMEQPILTQQKVMDLIMQQQALPNNTSEGLTATTWATKKQGFTDMLSGFRSPTGTTYRVALDLASVLFVSVAAADANRRSLMAQSEAQQKLVEQHEKHRERLEEEFTLNLKRIREENQKTLDQTVKIREELAKACQPGNNNGMVEKIEGHQGADIVK